MNTAKQLQQKQSKVTKLPLTQDTFNIQIHRKVMNQGKIIHHNRLLIIALIISQIVLAAWNIYTINSINESKLNQQIINQELIPTTAPKLQLIPASELA
jgi:hypothetical protein